MKETKSNWSCVTEEFQDTQIVELGRYASYWFQKSPRRVLHALSYYKFAAKLIGKEKEVIDFGCNEGLGTYLLGKECGFAKGIDFDNTAITQAKKNFSDAFVAFTQEDLFTLPPSEKWDAVTSFDVIEHIAPENASSFFTVLCHQLKPEGIAIIGTPSEISQQFASPISKKGHINIYSHTRLEEEMNHFFDFVFLFSANDEVIHTGFFPLAHYFLAVGCKKKESF